MFVAFDEYGWRIFKCRLENLSNFAVSAILVCSVCGPSWRTHKFSYLRNIYLPVTWSSVTLSPTNFAKLVYLAYTTILTTFLRCKVTLLWATVHCLFCDEIALLKLLHPMIFILCLNRMDQCLMWNAWSFLKNWRKQKGEFLHLKNRYVKVYYYSQLSHKRTPSGIGKSAR